MNAPIQITGSMLYSLHKCPHSVHLEQHGPKEAKQPVSDFVAMLWEDGVNHEAQTLAALGVTANFKSLPVAERIAATQKAMDDGADLIYGGRIADPASGLMGEPDLLKRFGQRYRAVDIKAGKALETDEPGSFRADYAAQLGLYIEILDNTGRGDGQKIGYIIDGDKAEVEYDFNLQKGKRKPTTWWEYYLSQKAMTVELVKPNAASRPALTADCKLCAWKDHCKTQLVADNDLSLIAELGRTKRDVMAATFPTVRDLAQADVAKHIHGGRTDFAGVGPDTLRKLQVRAKLLDSKGKPFAKAPIALPQASKEVMFDIEADPLRDLVYLHGFLEQDSKNPTAKKFCPVLAEGTDLYAEARAFAAAWQYLSDRAQDSVIYYYSPYERVAYLKLAAKHPQVCSTQEVADLFERPNVIDLYQEVIKPSTEWPAYDQSIKTLAVYLGFQWRDSNPSGAASIEWFNQWVLTGDAGIKQRILDYNEDDCIATAVVLAGVKSLSDQPAPHSAPVDQEINLASYL
jgi:predicted RecB family nuclease